MKIVIVGCGNVGKTLAQRLSVEGHDICVIDKDDTLVNDVSNKYDVLGVVGNGASLNVQKDAGVAEAVMMIAVTGNDELNLLCCLIAKKAGAQHTIARVSDPSYSQEFAFIKSGLGLSMIVNPQQALAKEIAKLLRFPSALRVDSFAKSRVDITVYRLEDGNPLCGLTLMGMARKYPYNLLITMVERDDRVIIPKGDFRLQPGDILSIVARQAQLIQFFRKLGIPTASVKSTMIIGGGYTAVYLIRQLMEMGIKVTVVNNDSKICAALSEEFPKALIINGDATDPGVLIEEGMLETGAFVALTNLDEVNVMLALYAKSVSKAKLITKVHRLGYDEIIDNLQVGSVMYPRFIVAEYITKYVRALQRGEGSNIETLYSLSDAGGEALEFIVNEGSPLIGKPLKNLKFRDNMLIACITHHGQTIIPNGDSVIEKGDTVILVTTEVGICDLENCLK